MKTFLKLLIIMICASITIFTQVEPTDTDGDGYLNISTLDHLRWISETPESWDKNFELDNDIDASDTRNWNNGKGFSPIGRNTSLTFNGIFQGNGYTINGIYSNGGFFGTTIAASIINLSLTKCKVQGSQVGGLVGDCIATFVSNCSIRGTITGTRRVGGLIGSISWSSKVVNCYSNCNVVGENQVGGLIGVNIDARVEECYSIGNVNGNEYVGGLIGDNFTVGGIIRNCYSKSNVKGVSYVGGLVGRNSGYFLVENSYSTGTVEGETVVGGFVGLNSDGEIENCFWDLETSGTIDSDGGTGKTTAEMKTKSTFTDAGWDFKTIWAIDGVTNDGYPFFRDGITSVEEEVIVVDEDSFSIFPNPASEYIVINPPQSPFDKGGSELASRGILEISIYNVLGEKVKTLSPSLSQSERELKVDVSALPNGTYIAVINTNNKIETVKFIINR